MAKWWLGLTLVLASCSGIVDFTTLDLQATPKTDNQVVEQGGLLSITFSPAVNTQEAERIFQVTSAGSTVSGDLRWSGNTLTFSPAPALVPGTRYVMSFIGSVHLQSGKVEDVAFQRPFFFVTKHPPLALLGWRRASTVTWTAPSFEPQSLGANEALEFLFNRAPDALSFDRALTLSPDPGRDLSWSAGGTIATVTPRTPWKGLTRYSWTISTKAVDADGVPLGEEVKGHWQTLTDTAAPVLSEAGRARRLPGGWTAIPPAEVDLDSDPLTTAITDGQDVVRLAFSEVMDSDSLDNLTWTPALTTVAQTFVDPNPTPHTVLLLTPERWEPAQVYALNVSPEVRDLAGNRLAATTVTVTVGFDYQKIDSIAFTPSTGTTTGTLTTLDEAIVPVALQKSGSEDRLQVAITFHLPYDAAQIPRVVQAFSLDAYFPVGSLSNPELINVSYSNRVLSMTYRGLVPNTASVSAFPGVRNLYHWQVQADPSLTQTSGGSFLKSPLSLYWEPTEELP